MHRQIKLYITNDFLLCKLPLDRKTANSKILHHAEKICILRNETLINDRKFLH